MIEQKSAGGVLYREIDSDIEVFVIKNSVQGYVLPKGRLEEGEDWLSAARREVKEETGYKVENGEELFIDHYTFTQDNNIYDKEVHYFCFQVNLNVLPEPLELDENEKITGGKWININKVFSILTFKSNKECVISLREKLSSK